MASKRKQVYLTAVTVFIYEPLQTGLWSELGVVLLADTVL